MTGLTTVHVGPAFRFLTLVLLLAFFPLSAHVSAQETRRSAADGYTPAALGPGAPTGFYALDGLDNINLFNGSLNFSLPLMKVGGRGAAGYTITLPIEQQWMMETRTWQGYYSGGVYYVPLYNFVTTTRAGYGPGFLEGRKTGDPLYCRCNYSNTMTRITFAWPNGSQTELRDVLTGGQPGGGQEACGCGPGVNRGRVFASTDGSAITFVSDWDIYDAGGNEIVADNGYEGFLPTGYLLMPDGTRYRIEQGKVSWIRDRNGNRTTFTYTQLGAMLSATDPLGRTVTVNYGVNDGAPYGVCDRITYTGFGGATRIIRVSRTSLGGALRAGQTLRSYGSLFPEITGDTATFNPQVYSAVWLPDGRAYRFRYNSYGELARVELPTGGAYEYDWAAGVNNHAASGALMYWTDTAPDGIYRRVVERRVYPNGSTLQGRKTFSRPESRNPNGTFSTTGQVVTEQFDAAGTRLSASRHNFYGSSVDSLLRNWPKWTTWKEGREWQTESLAADAQTVLTRVTHTWAQRAWLPWAGQGDLSPLVDPRVVQTVTTVEPSGANLVSKKDFAYDDSNNLTHTWEYDLGAGAPGPLLRHTHTEYVSLGGYTDHTGAHLRRLPSAMRVYGVVGGAETLLSHTETRYDEYSLTYYGGVTGWVDPGTAARGNATTIRRWLSTETWWPETHAAYDQTGNIISSTDARGNTSTTSFADSYADGVPRNTYAFPTQQSSPVPDPTGARGTSSPLVSSNVYDYWTGHVTSATNANGQTTTHEYNDALDRPTRVNRPDGGQTTFAYGRNAHGDYVHTSTRVNTSGTNADAYQFFDGLGRPSRSFSHDPQEASAPWLTTDIQYDALGRAWRTSAPYRSTGSGSPVNPSGRWSESSFDALGRVTQVRTTADNAVVTHEYSANHVTVTDQAGKRRRTFYDALARAVRVDEPDAAGNLGPPEAPAQPTYYAYDAHGNLRRVTQGGQSRYFMYDSLSRLIRAKNPEQAPHGSLAVADPVSGNSDWSLAYGYDANGNLTARLDARGVTTTYGYDNINRNITVRYSDGTKPIDRFYDGAANGRGRFHYSNWDPADNTKYETHLAIDEYDVMGRVKKYRQHFFTNGAPSHAFTVTRSYDLAGNVTSQTYPSGHTVSYQYDAGGRLTNFSGDLGDGVQRTYAANITYSEFGGVQQEQFGTQTPLYHKLHYNARGQLYDVRLSTVPWQTDQWNWNRGALVNYFSGNYEWGGAPGSSGSGPDNNGNLRLQQHWAPHDDQIGSYSYTQEYYDYDSLNRLASFRGHHGTPGGLSGQLVAQQYTYDRWGNMTVNTGQSYGAPHRDFDRGALAASNQLYAPGDTAIPDMSQRRMRYDAAGFLVHDSYTGAGQRNYDAEGRLSSAQEAGGGLATYHYDADGRRVKRRVHNSTVWQLYGMDGELLAEYAEGAAPFVPVKEYGYRGGDLLVTASSGDTDRMRRFVKNLYFNALAREPSAAELSQQINALAQAGAQGGQAQLLTASRTMARDLFQSAEYVGRNRTDAQYVTDLYHAYLQRAPDTPGLNWWVSNTQQHGRGATLNAFEVSAEFETLAKTVYGTAQGGDNQRVESFVRTLYLGSLQREPDSTEMQQQAARLNNAAAVSQSQVIAEARAMAGEIFVSTNYHAHRSVTEYVTDLYISFLGRQPDTLGLNWWVNNTNAHGRAATLEAFKQSIEYSELAGTLYRETFWLVPDQLGTPRMVVYKTGSLAGVRRHDYLPFGEEVGAGVGGRSAAQGYSQHDGVRQGFTGYERDGETGLNFAQARVYSSAQGRFTSPDPLAASGKVGAPQTWNRYTYVLNNPLILIDPSGLIWGTKEDDPHYRWFANAEEMEKAGYKAATKFVYEVNGTWYAVNPNANQYKTFTNEWNAKQQFWSWTGLPPSRWDYVPVVGSMRAFFFNYATGNFEKALGNFFMAGGEGGTSFAGVATAGRAAVTRAFATESGEAVFWTGGTAAKDAATTFAVNNGGKTIGMTPGGKALSLLDNVPYQFTKPLWNWGSRKFAEGASGEVNVFIRGTASPNSIWFKTELPSLLSNPRAIKPVVEHAVP